MALINENFLKLPESYLFSDIKKKVEAFKHLHPDANIISLGIGDVTRPIAPVVIEALHAAVDEMGDSKTFRGYGPEQGYDFLQKKIIENDYIHRGVDLAPDEIFISDGYLEEGPEGFAIERRGRGSRGRPPKKLPKDVEEDLLALCL